MEWYEERKSIVLIERKKEGGMISKNMWKLKRRNKQTEMAVKRKKAKMMEKEKNLRRA